MPESYTPVTIFILAPGAFFVLAMLSALQNYIKNSAKRAGKNTQKLSADCGEDCAGCGGGGCVHKFYDASPRTGKEENVTEIMDLEKEEK